MGVMLKLWYVSCSFDIVIEYFYPAGRRCQFIFVFYLHGETNERGCRVSREQN